MKPGRRATVEDRRRFGMGDRRLRSGDEPDLWGTGNPGPWMGDKRPGDNLYTASLMALDAASGKTQGPLRYHQNDLWDWDEVSPPIMVDYQAERTDGEGVVTLPRRLSLDA